MSAYAKAIVATVIAALIALQAALTDGGVDSSEWVKIALAAMGVLTVYLVPNTPSDKPVV